MHDVRRAAKLLSNYESWKQEYEIETLGAIENTALRTL